MPLDLTADCIFTGPALPEPFVKFNLEAEINRLSLLPKAVGPEARGLIGLFAALGWQTVAASEETFGPTGTLRHATKGEAVRILTMRLFPA